MTTLRTHVNILLRRARALSHIDPARDWIMLVICSTVVLASIIVWNAWAFDTVANGGVIGTLATTTPPAFSRSSFDTVHAIFAHRADEETKYVTGVYRYTDPSQ